MMFTVKEIGMIKAALDYNSHHVREYPFEKYMGLPEAGKYRNNILNEISDLQGKLTQMKREMKAK